METMHLLREDLWGQGVRMLVAAVALVTVLVGGFGWDPLMTAIGTVGGGIGFATWEYRREVRTRLPQGALPPAPPQAAWPPRERWVGELVNVLMMGAALAGVVALAGDEERALIGSLVIARFAGTGVAALVGERRVADWERRHGLRVAFSGEDEDERRFAVHPLALISRT